MIYVSSIEHAKERVQNRLVVALTDLAKKCGTKGEDLSFLQMDVHNDNSGDWIACMLMVNMHGKFTVSRSVHENAVRVVMNEVIICDKGPAIIDIILKFDPNSCTGVFEFAPIVCPAHEPGCDPKSVMQYTTVCAMLIENLKAGQDDIMIVKGLKENGDIDHYL